MTPKQQSRALRLYMAYKTRTAEYGQIAASIGLTEGQLNARMCELRNARDAARRRRRAAGLDDHDPSPVTAIVSITRDTLGAPWAIASASNLIVSALTNPDR
jgi:hypothetical protein